MPETIRPARSDEAPVIAALWHDGWRDGHIDHVPAALIEHRTPESFRIRTDRHLAGMRVAARAGTLLGFHLIDGDELNQFYVAPAARGTGLAARLLADAEAALGAADHRRAWLACAVGNARARRFYEKSGWQVAATVPVDIETLDTPYRLNVWRLEKSL